MRRPTAARRGVQLVRQNAGWWMQRLAHPSAGSPRLIFGNAAGFQEAAYLARHPGCARGGGGAGNWPSGQVHYKTVGFSEGRGI